MGRILLVEDHVSLREALASVLDGEPDIEVIGQASSMKEARRLPVGEADLAIVDLGLPDRSGADLIPVLHETNPALAVLILTASLDRVEIARAVEAGAAGVMNKAVELDDLIGAVRRLLAGEVLLSHEEVSSLLRLAARKKEQDFEARRKVRELTRREREVLQCLSEGLGRREVAEKLGITIETEHTHVSRILKKLGAHSRLQALVFAMHCGIIEIPTRYTDSKHGVS